MLPSSSDRLALKRRHIAEMHPRRSRGKICTARAGRDGRAWDEGLVAPSSKALSRQLAEAEVEYQGQLRFSGRRSNANVTGIGAASLDYDYYGAGLPYADLSAEDVASLLIEAYDKAGIPRISFVQDSGRGGYSSWLFTAQMSGDALPRWQKALQGLRGPTLDADGNVPKPRPRRDKDGNVVEPKIDPKIAAFNERMLPVWRLHRDLGLDTGAIDPARVLKVMGTIHHETGRMSRMAWPSSWEDVERVDFDTWCDALMPYTRAEMRALRAERAEWKKVNPDWTPPVRKLRQARNGPKWQLIGEDLDRLLDHRGQGWFRENKKRNWWVLFRAIAIAMTEGGTARGWAEHLAPRIGLPVTEVASSLKGVERGMHAHDAGERRDWKGSERPAFYDYSYTTIADRILVDVDVAVEAGLLVVRPDGAPARTDAERKRISRAIREPHRNSREAQADGRLGWGAYARLMQLDGATYADLEEAFGKGEDTIRRAIREADSLLSETVPVMSEQPVEETTEARTPEEVSQPIVGMAPIPHPAVPSAQTAAPSASTVPAGEIRVRSWTRFYAEIATATGRWDWIRVEGVYGPGWHDELRLLTPSAAVSAADRALVDQAVQDLARGAAKPARRSHHSECRPPSRRRPAHLQAVPLAPLDGAADRAREAQLYLEASGGRSSLRDRLRAPLALVTA